MGIATPFAIANVEAIRVKVMELLIDIQKDHTELSFFENDDKAFYVPANWSGLYYPSDIPDGFAIAEMSEIYCDVTYINEAGAKIYYSEYQPDDLVDINSENATLSYKDASEDMIMIRCSHSSYVIGVILHIIVLSLLYWAAIFIYSFIVMMPFVEFDLGWGTLYMALNRGAGNSSIGMGFIFSKKLQQLLTPVEATIMSWTLHCIISVFLGQIVCLVNSHEKSVGGSIFALALVIFDYCFRGLGMPYAVYYFSPVSWSNLNMLDMTKTTPFPSVLYAYIVLFSLCILNIGWLLFQKAPIHRREVK